MRSKFSSTTASIGLRNNGDLAMGVVTLQRINERWPRARIGVLTDAPLLLHGYLPEAEAITVGAAHDWPVPMRAVRLRASAPM
jgi:hypothetical protein